MKFAIFLFDDTTCEVGETSWIVNEDTGKFTNKLWSPSTEVVVKWPKDFGKISRKLGKTPINIDEMSSILCTATIATFNDNYETIKKQMANYLKTGETETPTRGRGHRVQKKPTHNEWASYEEDEDSFAPEKPKKRKCLKRSDASMLSLVKEKYSLDNAIDNEDSDKGDEDHEVSELRRKNQGLQKKCQRLEGEVIDLKQEVRDMREIMLNMKESSKVNQALTELTKTIKLLHSHRPLKGRSSSSSSSSLSRSSSPSTLVKTNQHFKETTAVNEDNQSDDSDSDMVVIYPGISVLKAQKKMLDMCGDAKTYTYTLMEIIWSREVLASHSMTGKPSNAHKDKEPKPCLDIVKVKALCALVATKFKTVDEQKVKNLIKSKLQNVEKCSKLKKEMSAEK